MGAWNSSSGTSTASDRPEKCLIEAMAAANIAFGTGCPNTMASGVIRAEFPDWRPVIANIPNSQRGLARFKCRVTVWNPAFLKHLRTHDETGR